MFRFTITQSLIAFQPRLDRQKINLDKLNILRGASIPGVIRFMLILLVLSLFPIDTVYANPVAEDHIPTPAEVIEAINELRVNQGLSTLSVHPVLMQVAQIEANGIASGSDGHWRPPGLTLGQWLISLGYPLSGDLTQDGYRSENWIIANTAKGAIKAWKGSADHNNTMLSPDRSDIGVGIAVADNQVYIVLVTALQTASGKMQSNASLILTQACSSTGAPKGFLPSQYINPVVLSTARSEGDVFHKIQYGQSLWSIAVAYRTTIDQLRAWNNLGEEIMVYEGQVLLVQRSATQPPPATNTAVAIPTLPIDIKTQPPSPATLTVSPPIVMQSSPNSGVENEATGTIPMGWRVGIIIVMVGLAGLLSLLFLQRVK